MEQPLSIMPDNATKATLFPREQRKPVNSQALQFTKLTFLWTETFYESDET